MSTSIDRRSFLKLSGCTAAGAVFSSPLLNALTARPAVAQGSGLGTLTPLPPANGGPTVLALPEGFTYTTFGATGSPLMSGGVHAQSHDGMAALPTRHRNVTRLTRNQEIRTAPGTPAGIGAVGGPAETRYDPKGVGGVTVIDFDSASGQVVNEFVGINGTFVNCAGGIAFRGSGWITCEETTEGPPQGWERKHGYAFLMPGDAGSTVPAVPLVAMGRFAHEACATDQRGIVYQTEDAGSGRPSGFYRFLGNPNRLDKGGQLEMLAIEGQPGVDLRENQTPLADLPVTWVTIDAPDPDPVIDFPSPGANSCFAQGFAKGGARFNRLEGIWSDGERIVFGSTSGGDAKNGDVNSDGYREGYGQIWEYTGTAHAEKGSLRLIYESPGGTILDSPDNLVLTPRGGIILCEDDASDIDADTHPLAPGVENVNRVVGMAPGGEPFEFAVNVLNDSEFAGACFSPDGTTMFVNVFGGGEPGSGMTCAITGPWERGGL